MTRTEIVDEDGVDHTDEMFNECEAFLDRLSTGLDFDDVPENLRIIMWKFVAESATRRAEQLKN